MSKVGRGEALRKFLKEKLKKPEEEPDPPPPQEVSSSEVSATRRGTGRGALFLKPMAEAAPSAEPVRPLGRGRALLLAQQAFQRDVKIKSVGPSISPGEKTERPRSEVKARSSSPTSTITSDVSQLSIHSKPPVVMKGSYGKEVKMTCNYMKLKLESGKGVFEYEVKFIPDIEYRNFRFNCLSQHKDVIGETKVFDGVTLHLPFQLPENVTVLSSKLPSDDSDVELRIIFKRKKLLGETIQLYNVLFRRVMNKLGFALMGRHFFDPNSGKPIPAHKLEVWPGFITAIDEYEGGVMLCCDASHRVLRTVTVYDLMMDMKSVMEKQYDWTDALINNVVGKSVLTRYNNKVYRVDDVIFDKNPLCTFTFRGNTEMTYVEYYKKVYDITIRYTDQPLLVSKTKKRIKGEEVTSLVHLIPEVCYITGLTDEMRSDFKVMKDVAQFTRIEPSQRQYALKKFIQTVNTNEETRRILGSWGLHVEDGTVGLPGRIIPPEDIYFGAERKSDGSLQADWTRGATSNPVISAVDMRKWLMVYPRREEKTINDFTEMLKKCSPQLGMRIDTPTYLAIQDDSTESYLRVLKKNINKEAQLVLVLLLAARADKYSAVKKLCCIEAPIPSQVVLCRTIRRYDRLRSVCQKIALQMNCKLGGTLWAVKVPLKNAMVCGIDTYHDPSRKSSSIAALVTSLNQPLTRWYSKICKQEPGIELMEGLAVGFLAALAKYKDINGNFPDQILIFRDGVGDGQLPYCQEYEFIQFQKSCQIISDSYKPKFLFVVVQKKINTRLFMQKHDSYENPSPGAVMDHTITRRNWFDFFLVSQSVRQGTVSPTHYVVIHNSTSMNPDQIQRISYKLTHLYYNWSGTIRVPAPCQYAHKLAYLVGESIHKEANEHLLDKLFFL